MKGGKLRRERQRQTEKLRLRSACGERRECCAHHFSPSSRAGSDRQRTWLPSAQRTPEASARSRVSGHLLPAPLLTGSIRLALALSSRPFRLPPLPRVPGARILSSKKLGQDHARLRGRTELTRLTQKLRQLERLTPLVPSILGV